MDKHGSIMPITYYYSDKIKHDKLHMEFWLGIMKVQGQLRNIQGGSNMTGTDLCVNKPHCAAAVRP